MSRAASLLVALLILLLAGSFVVWPGLDLAVSGLFADGTRGFFWRDAPWLLAFEKMAWLGSRLLGAGFLVALLFALWRRGPCVGLGARGWAFLLLGLLIGPGLVANVVLKDNWGRARPRDVAAFGGTASFTPALLPATQCAKNCSFVAGDAAFGFFLSAAGYVVRASRRRRVFWSGMAAGLVFGGARVALGAHFPSDVLFAGIFMLATLAALHAALFGRKETMACWRDFGFGRAAPVKP